MSRPHGTRSAVRPSLTELFFRLLLALYPRRVSAGEREDMLWLFRRLEADAVAEGRGVRFAAAATLDALGGLRRAYVPDRSLLAPARRAERTEFMSTLSHDVKVSLRRLARRPGNTAVAAFTLALGVGAVTAIFSVFYGVLLRPLGLTAPESLALVTLHHTERPSDTMGFWPSHLEALRDQAGNGSGLEGVAVYYYDSATLEGEGEALELDTALIVDGDFFSVLGPQPLVGRGLTREDVAFGRRSDVCVIGEQLWRSRFGADPRVLGRDLLLDGRTVSVVGVMPNAAPLPVPGVDVWIAEDFQPQNTALSGRLSLIARVDAPSSLSTAEASLAAAVTALLDEDPRLDGYTAGFHSFQDHLVGSVRNMIWTAAVGVSLLLLIACVNLASLQLARAVTREQEMATRRALGARRTQVFSQVLCESLVLSLLGGVLGVALAAGLHQLLVGLATDLLPRIHDVKLDLPVLGFALATSVAAGLLFGMLPVLFTFTRDLASSMRSALGAERPAWTRMRSAFVIVQVAMAVALSVGAVLMARSLVALGEVDPGFDGGDVGIARIFLDGDAYAADQQKAAYFDQLRELLLARPDIDAVGASSGLPMDPITIDYDVPYALAGEDPRGDVQRQAFFRTVTAGYFDAMDIPLQRGRLIDGSDRADGEQVAVINATFARRAWTGDDPVGQTFSFYGGSRTVRVVGVVGDVRFAGPADGERAEFFVPHRQITYGAMTVAARSSLGDPESAAAAISRAALELNPSQPVHSFFAMSSLESQAVASPRFLALLLSAFAIVALLLAAAGIFGALAGWVADRRREISLRVALGAGGSDILRLVFGRSALLSAVGLGLGLAIVKVGAGLLAPHLFGVDPQDAVSLGAVAIAVVVVTLTASLLPAARAARLQPTQVLRSE
ncbi:MAG: ADOP family duplicated permease [Acidobacteriota bacterium]